MNLDHFIGAGAALALWLALRLLAARSRARASRAPWSRERVAQFIKDREM